MRWLPNNKIEIGAHLVGGLASSLIAGFLGGRALAIFYEPREPIDLLPMYVFIAAASLGCGIGLLATSLLLRSRGLPTLLGVLVSLPAYLLGAFLPLALLSFFGFFLSLLVGVFVSVGAYLSLRRRT